MHLILRYPNGRRLEALLLKRGEDEMRVVLRGRNETLELQVIAGRWFTQSGERVSIEAIAMDHYQGGRHTNTKYTTAAETTNTANAAQRSSATDRMN
jgi:hypothetical protein